MKANKIYDVIGIGIGPFNLGLAALATGLPELNCLFIDQKPSFDWHPGLMIPGTRMQVPYYADLVTLADPQSLFSYPCFLKATERTYRLGVGEQLFPLRREYNQYCQWVARQLPSLKFGWQCQRLDYDETQQCYVASAYNSDEQTLHTFHAKHLAIGIGTAPYIPACASNVQHRLLLHSADYLHKKEALLQAASITIIGSGQSAAEIFYDLLPYAPRMQQLSWFTRSGFWPMDYSKFALEMACPEYIDYFYHLPPETKRILLHRQDLLYKGINKELISAIYTQLYEQEIEYGQVNTTLMSGCELSSVQLTGDKQITLALRHLPAGKRFTHHTETLILATGYQYPAPAFLWPIASHIRWARDGGYQVNRNFTIDHRQRIFVQNAELHTHGFNSADLGMGPYRNAMILNTVLGREHFKIERGRPFQRFEPSVVVQPF